MSRFVKATRSQSRLRLALDGAGGSGKTYTALKLAKLMGWRVALIETERGSASKYAGEFDFDAAELTEFSPRAYREALHDAEEGHDVVIVDSLSHAWAGIGGALEMKDRITAKSRDKNGFAAWREVTPEHNALVDAILNSPLHVIATMRVKTEWVVEKDPETGKNKPRKIGTQTVQRDGMEYEFDVVGDLDDEHTLTIGKSRVRLQRASGPAVGEWYNPLDGRRFPQPGADVANILRAWLSDGAAVPVTKQASVVTPQASPVTATPAGYSGTDPEKRQLADLVRTLRKDLAGDRVRLQRIARVLVGQPLDQAHVIAALAETEPKRAA